MVYTSESVTRIERYFLNCVQRDLAGARVYIYTFTSSANSYDLLNAYGDKLIQIEIGQRCEVLFDSSGEHNKLLFINLINDARVTKSTQSQTHRGKHKSSNKTSRNLAKKESPYMIPRTLTRKEILSGKDVITVGAGGLKKKPVDQNRVLIKNKCSRKYKTEPIFDSFFDLKMPEYLL